jgi:hypothetical protein
VGGLISSVENLEMDHRIYKLIDKELNSVHRMSRTKEPQFTLKCIATCSKCTLIMYVRYVTKELMQVINKGDI